MRVVIQRVAYAKVKVDKKTVGEIEKGLMVLLGITEEDNDEDIQWLSNKICNLRIFNDEENKMNKSLKDIDGGLLLVSQFTLHASTKKGNRPSFIAAAKPEIAIPIYEKTKAKLEEDLGKPVQTGIFGADMKITLLNDGPVTITIDSKNRE